MADDRDFRLRVDLSFTADSEGAATGVLQHAVEQLAKAVVINEGQDNEERGFISLERCGHRLGIPCDIIARWAVGKGQVI